MKISLTNIESFVKGHANYILARLCLYPKYKQEQVLYRLSVCKDDCVTTGKCVKCGCPVNKKVYAPLSCNDNSRFPDIMSKDKWESFKHRNNITLTE